MAIGSNAAVYFYGTEVNLSTTATTATVATTAISTAASLDEWANSDDAPLASFVLEVDDWSGAPTAGGTIDLYVRLMDTTGAGNDEPVHDANYTPHYVGSFVVDAASAAQYLALGPVSLPAYETSQNYAFTIVNNTSVTMGSTTDKWRIKVTPITVGPHA